LDDVGVWGGVSVCLRLEVGFEEMGKLDVPKPSIAMPALFMTKSMPSGCAAWRCSVSVCTLVLSVTSKGWNLMSARPPSDRRAFACCNWGSF
jgi:hypothetical protein